MTVTEAYFSLFGTAFDAVFKWFVSMLNASGALQVFLLIFTIICVVRFLVVPLIGNAITDAFGEVGDN